MKSHKYIPVLKDGRLTRERCYISDDILLSAIEVRDQRIRDRSSLVQRVALWIHQLSGRFI